MNTGFGKKATKAVCGALLASAMLGTDDARAEPGDGIRVGDSTTVRIRLGAGAEFRSNAYKAVGRQSGDPADAARAAFNFVLNPGINLVTVTPKVRFLLDGDYTLRQFFKSEFRNLNQPTNFRLRARLDGFPQGVVGFHIQDVASLVNRADDNRFFNNALLSQLRNDLQGGITFRVGPEFSIDTKVGWAHHNFRVPGVQEQRTFNTRNTITPSLALAWRFFPKTAFVVEANLDLHRWKENWVETSVVPGNPQGGSTSRSFGRFLAMPDSTHVKALTGVRGRFTEHLIVALLVGYGTAGYNVDSVLDESASAPGLAGEDDATDVGFDAGVTGANGILGLARVQFDLGHVERRSFGQLITMQYRRDFTDSFFTNYLASHHLTGLLQSRWGRYVDTRVGVGARFEDYKGEVDRNDIYLDAGGTVVIHPAKWFDIDLDVRWVQRASSQTELQYDNTVVGLMLRFQY